MPGAVAAEIKLMEQRLTRRTLPSERYYIREWRAARRMNQLDLALEAGMSARHLSCVETGKSQASREIVGRPANALGMPLREHNRYRVLVRALAVTNIGGADAPYIPDPRGVDWAAVMALTAHLGAFLSGANS